MHLHTYYSMVKNFDLVWPKGQRWNLKRLCLQQAFFEIQFASQYHLPDYLFSPIKFLSETSVCRIGFVNQTESTPLDWTLGAFIFQSMQEPPELEHKNQDRIVGNESVTYFSLFAFLLIATLAAIFVLQWRKPQLKTIYDLEKGRYIVTRVPR